MVVSLSLYTHVCVCTYTYLLPFYGTNQLYAEENNRIVDVYNHYTSISINLGMCFMSILD